MSPIFWAEAVPKEAAAAKNRRVLFIKREKEKKD
jgi:hypothetical protein